MSDTVENPNTDVIKALSLMLLDMRTEEEGLVSAMHNIKTLAVLDVESQWETTKDKALSNAMKRNVEVEYRLSEDAEYMQMSARYDDLHREIQTNQIELDFQRREFQRQNGNAAISVMLERIAEALERQ